MYKMVRMICRVRAIIKGKVQGVFFRASAAEIAKSFNIHGYVRNRNDNSVELDAEGTKDKLIELLQWCAKGPPEALVESVETTWLDNLIHYPNFTIQYGTSTRE